MKCITVAQPFAWAVLARLERIIFRCYGTDHRGELLIYAGPQDDAWYRAQLALYRGAPCWGELPRGQVVGVAELWACERCSQGEWAWGLRDPRFVQPFPVRPGRRLFEVAYSRVRLWCG